MINKSLLTLLCSMLSLCTSGLFASNLPWQTNYQAALQQAKSSSKPMVLFFTGSDWCSWCTKLEQEVFNTPEFAQSVGNKFIFVLIDFPVYAAQDPQIKAQNKELQQRFNVRSFPTVVLFNAQQNQQIGTTGYRAGGGKQYADYLLKMSEGYSSYKQTMSTLDTANPSGSDLKKLYEQAKKLQLDEDAIRIVKRGMDSDESHFFMIERYRFLADEGQIHAKEALRLRHELLAADPANKKQIPYQVALIEFGAFNDEMEKENYSVELAIAPLIDYIEKYGSEDKENLWRTQMIIAQVYLDKNQMVNALKYAQDCYDSAPPSARPEIARAVEKIRSQVHLATQTTK